MWYYLIIYEHCDDAADVVRLLGDAVGGPHLDHHGLVGRGLCLGVAGGAHNRRGNFSNLEASFGFTCGFFIHTYFYSLLE